MLRAPRNQTRVARCELRPWLTSPELNWASLLHINVYLKNHYCSFNVDLQCFVGLTKVSQVRWKGGLRPGLRPRQMRSGGKITNLSWLGCFALGYPAK